MFSASKWFPVSGSNALAIAAMMTPALFAAAPTQAAVIEVNLNLVFEDAQGAPTEPEFNVDINGDGLVDLDLFVHGSLGAAARGGTGGGSSNSRLLRNDALGVVRNLTPGTTVDASLVSGGAAFESGGFGVLYRTSGPAEQEFQDGVIGYIALEIDDLSDMPHYAWVEVLVEKAGVRVGVEPNDDPGARVTLLRAAYESESGVGLTIPIPEPASLSLLTAGILMIASRRRK